MPDDWRWFMVIGDEGARFMVELWGCTNPFNPWALQTLASPKFDIYHENLPRYHLKNKHLSCLWSTVLFFLKCQLWNTRVVYVYIYIWYVYKPTTCFAPFFHVSHFICPTTTPTNHTQQTNPRPAPLLRSLLFTWAPIRKSPVETWKAMHQLMSLWKGWISWVTRWMGEIPNNHHLGYRKPRK